MPDEFIEDTSERISLKEVWQIFLESIARFWDRRFRDKPTPEFDLLRQQLDYLTRENHRLISLLIEKQNPEDLNPKSLTEEDLKPIRNFEPSWTLRAKRLEERSRQLAAEQRKQKESEAEIRQRNEELEKELGIS